MRRRGVGLAAALALLLGGCGTSQARPAAAPMPAGEAGEMTIDAGTARFAWAPGLALVRVPREALANVDGSPRVASDDDYARFWRDVAPRLEEWARDPRLGINPAYVAALLAKESGYEPLALSNVPANGYPQMTHIADADLRAIAADAAAFRWMDAEVRAWPRHPAVHAADASRARTTELLRTGAVTPANEYLFDPVTSTRAAVMWLRVLRTVWTEDAWPGFHGRLARERLNGGRPLTDAQVLDLVTASYNQGHPLVADLVRRHGPSWTAHLPHEAADHLERIRHYTTRFQGAR